jgi:hypothetical protein
MGFREDAFGSGRPVVIFGASILGEVVLQAMELCGLRPVCFGDNDAAKQERLLHGYEVASLETIHSKYPDAVVVIGAGRYYSQIHKQLSENGYARIYNDADIIDAIDFAAVPYDKVKGIVWRLAQLGRLSRIQAIPTDALHLERLNIVVTERCTLRCRHCSSLMPSYRKPRDCDTALLLEAIDRIMSCAAFIYHMEVLGGEVFLNRDLAVIIATLSQYDNIFQIDVITNGTMLPDKELLIALKRDNICVVVNDYGAVSKKKDTLLALLGEIGVKNRLNKHWAWADLGKLSPRNRDAAQLTALFQRCNFRTCTELLHGELHRCPRSSHGMNTGLMRRYDDDYVNVYDKTVGTAELKEQIRRLIEDKTFIQACNYCDGNTSDSLMLEPAEQNHQEKK